MWDFMLQDLIVSLPTNFHPFEEYNTEPQFMTPCFKTMYFKTGMRKEITFNRSQNSIQAVS